MKNFGLLFFIFVVLANSIAQKKLNFKNKNFPSYEKQVSEWSTLVKNITKTRPISLEDKRKLDQVIVCPTQLPCCIIVWDTSNGNSAPTSGFTISPCSNKVYYSSPDVTVSPCNTVAVPPEFFNILYLSTGCNTGGTIEFNNLESVDTCSSTDCAFPIAGGTNPGYFIGSNDASCATITACDCYDTPLNNCAQTTDTFVSEAPPAIY